MNHFLKQYKNLSREIYILFIGRVVTSMGSFIWPLLTLIMKNKLGYGATFIAAIDLMMMLCSFPMLLLGGKLADKGNRKNIIVICDLVTITAYIVCGILPLSNFTIVLLYIASMFATLEGPSYDALIADLSCSAEREQAYSLQYLGVNLGLVLSPTIGGLLFENHLGLAFIIDGLCTLPSTILILLFIKRLKVENTSGSVYEEARHEDNIFKILKGRPTFFFYLLATGFASLVYSQFNYLLPLNIEALYGAKGAAIFGTLTSVNALVVILATPVITTLLTGFQDVKRLLTGEILIVAGLFCFRFAQGKYLICVLLMILFTLGEVFKSISDQPYETRRMPESHRGRWNSAVTTVAGAFSGLGNLMFGRVIEGSGYTAAWNLVLLMGSCAVALYVYLVTVDKKSFPLLYEKPHSEL